MRSNFVEIVLDLAGWCQAHLLLEGAQEGDAVHGNLDIPPPGQLPMSPDASVRIAGV